MMNYWLVAEKWSLANNEEPLTTIEVFQNNSRATIHADKTFMEFGKVNQLLGRGENKLRNQSQVADWKNLRNKRRT
jgi:hypothetical protein